MKRKIIIVSSISVGVTIIAAIIINILFKFNLSSFFTAEWDAGDALAYVGAILGSVSTFILGYVAYKQNEKMQEQNEKLQKLEENNYIANFSGMLLIDTIEIDSINNIPCNYDLHDEQILSEEDIEELNSPGFEFTITASKLGDALPAMIHISSCTIFAGPKENIVALSSINIGDHYTRIAIGKTDIRFKMTVLIKSKNKELFDKALKNHGEIMSDFEFEIVTDKYVMTKCKCRADCDYKLYSDKISWRCGHPMVFFYGHEMLDKNSIKISGEVNENE